MKKNKIIFSLIMCVLVFCSIFCISINTSNFVYAESNIEQNGNNANQENNGGQDGENNSIGYTPITTLAQLKSLDVTKSYILKNNIDASDGEFTTISGTFTGKLDGNGCTISGLTTPLFENVGANAQITKLHIDASSIIISEEESVNQKNYGLIANTISGAVVSQIKITNCNINCSTENPEILSNTNLGLVAGKINDGSKVQNCQIEGYSISLKIGNTEAQNFNIGTIAGVVENTTISNNIINIYGDVPNQSKLITVNSNYQKTLNIGGIVGKLNTNQNYIFNNVVILSASNISLADSLSTSQIGIIAGEIAIEQDASNIEGILTTTIGDLFGIRQSSDIVYKKVNVVEYAQLSSSIFSDAELKQTYWKGTEEFKWDYFSTWMNITSVKTPKLQCYEKFTSTFSVDDSIKSLNLETMPTGNVLTSELKTEGDIAVLADVNSISYNSTIYITVSIEEQNHYQDFFYISALKLDNSNLENFGVTNGIVYNNVTNESFGIDVSLVQEEGAGNEEESLTHTYTYKIQNFNANCAGTYSVILGRQSYYLTVNVHDVGTEETGSIIPGKFKIESNTYESKTLELKYGEKFSISTSVTNTDYSDKAFWHIYNNKEVDYFEELIPFNPVEENANFYSNKIEFTFNENCSLFKGAEGSEKKYFDFATYSSELNDNDEVVSNFELNIVYTKRVKLVKIVLMFDNDEQIKTQYATLFINNSDDRITWNEEEGVYYAKVAFDRGTPLEYSISINEMVAGAEFNDWYFDSGLMERLTKSEENEKISLFEIEESTEEPLVIYCVFNADANLTDNNLIWLWITLAVVGVVLVMVIIFIIVKKKRGGRGGGSSYKKYYY